MTRWDLEMANRWSVRPRFSWRELLVFLPRCDWRTR